MHYKSGKYNLPIAIWLPLKFPVSPPVAYVKRNPKQFIFNTKCRIIDPSQDGRIISDYVRNWSYPTSNLSDFVGDLRVHFAEYPPLYQAPPTAAATGATTTASMATMTFNPLSPNANTNPMTTNTAPTTTTTPSSSIWAGITTTASGSSGSGNIPTLSQQQQAAIEPPGGVSLWSGALAQQQAQQAAAAKAARDRACKQQRDAAYHTALITALTTRIAGALESVAAAEKQRQLTIQNELVARSGMLGNQVLRLQQERVALDRAAHELSAAAMALDQWLRENEGKAQGVRAAMGPGDIDPDEAIVPADPLSKQALDAQSADVALEDTLSVLDRVFEQKRGGLGLSEYLGQVRGVSRRQFTARALSSKIASKQQATEKMNVAMQGLRTGEGSTVGAGVPPPPPPPPPSLPPSTSTSTQQQPAQLPIGDLAYHSTGGILLNPLAAAAKNMR